MSLIRNKLRVSNCMRGENSHIFDTSVPWCETMTSFNVGS